MKCFTVSGEILVVLNRTFWHRALSSIPVPKKKNLSAVLKMLCFCPVKYSISKSTVTGELDFSSNLNLTNGKLQNY